MKQLFWILALFNLGLFAYFNAGHILPSKPQAKLAEINPEKIIVLSQAQLEALPKKTVPSLTLLPEQTAPIAASCFEWGIFSDTNIANAQSAISQLALSATLKQQSSQQAKRFWVYRAPLRSAAEAQLKAAELKALGVENLFVVQDAKWKNAISFGIFEDEQLAIKLLNELKAKGVKDVVKALRNQGKGHASLLFSNLTETDVAALKKLKPDFPYASLKEISCH
ncbi:MAG: sporulation protein [Methylotenera sp.]|nr:sporulation protein [Methylotenera sp.]